MTVHLSEREVMRQIADYLLARGILFFRMQTGAHEAQYKGEKRIIRYGTPGMADLLAFPAVAQFLYGNGVGQPPRKMGALGLKVTPLWIECKSSSGKQRPEQISFQKIVEDNGHGYILARGYEDVESWLKARGL